MANNSDKSRVRLSAAAAVWMRVLEPYRTNQPCARPLTSWRLKPSSTSRVGRGEPKSIEFIERR